MHPLPVLPAWTTFNVCPPIWSWALRLVDAGLPLAVNVTTALPLPLAGVALSQEGSELTADQAQAAGAVRLTPLLLLPAIISLRASPRL